MTSNICPAQFDEMANLIRMHDWGRTPLGPISAWSERLHGIIDAMLLDPVPIAILWGKEGILLYNAGYAEICGQRHPRVLGTPLREAWPEAADFNGRMLDDVMTGQSLIFRDACFRLERNNMMRESWFDLYYGPVVDADGEIFAIKATVIETTEKVLAEQRRIAQQHQLTEVAGRLQGLAAATSDIIYRMSPDWAEMWELDGRGFIKDTAAPYRSWITDYIPTDEQERVYTAISSAIRNKANFELEHRVLRVDGSIGWTFSRAVPMLNAHGDIEEWIGAASDISERKEAERALRESERLFRTVFESIDEGFCVIEFVDGPHGPLSDYVHVMANPAYALNAGIENVVGQRVRDMMPLEGEDWVAIYRKVLITGESVRFERELERTGRYLELAALRIEPAKRRQVAVLFQDVTERHQAETALRELNETLERRVLEEVAKSTRIEDALHQAQKMEAVGQLTGGIAHDFNNMLAVISHALELMGRRSAYTDERNASYLELAKNTVTRATQLTRRLLAFSRQQPLDPRPVQVNELITDMFELLEHSLGGNIVLDTVLDPDVKSICADPNQLENIIVNLAVNARDAMERGGRLTIETKNCILDKRFAVAQEDFAPGPYVMIAVRDTGTGMSAEVLSKAFEPFFTTKKMGHGTGLGLSQVYGYVRQSGGQVRVDSELGRGTVITLYLPEYTATIVKQTNLARVDAIEDDDTSEAILVVDDEPDIRTLLVDMLTNLGYRIFSAEGGKAALQVLAQHPEIKLLISDVLMPVMNGRELADEALKRHPHLKILFMTGYAGNVVLSRAKPEKVIDVIDKPFAMKNIEVRVRGLLDQF